MKLTEQFTVPNLDAESRLDWSELDLLSKDLTRLARYAGLKASAMRNRLGGKITLALIDEEECERIYNTLPVTWRW
jgi:hypothetical protein